MRLSNILLSLLLVSGSAAALDASSTDEINKKAQQGDVNAQYYLGFQYELGLEMEQNNEQAYYWYSQAAKQGDARSQYALGYLYSEGIGVQRDLQQAKEWFEMSSAQDYPEAQYALASFYYNGMGVEANYDLAKELFGEACDSGQWEACEEYQKIQSLGI